jgi:ATP-dependent protease HslVU (ClpYQ) peptidase subunit
MLVVLPSRKVVCYGQGPYPLEIEDRFTAMGCGRDYALAAMYLGHDARRAVEVACAIDVNCGCGIDTLELE